MRGKQKTIVFKNVIIPLELMLGYSLHATGLQINTKVGIVMYQNHFRILSFKSNRDVKLLVRRKLIFIQQSHTFLHHL